MQKNRRDVDGGEFIPHLKRRESFAKHLEAVHLNDPLFKNAYY